MSDDRTLSDGVKKMNITGETSGYSSGEQRTSGSGSGPPQRKADLAYNHLQLVQRPGACKAARGKINVTTNYFRLGAPGRIRYVTFRLDFELAPTRKGGRMEPPKKEQMQDLFQKCYKQHAGVFPKQHIIVYNGTDMIYCPADFKMTATRIRFNAADAGRPGGRQPAPREAYVTITPLGLSEIPTVQVDNEQDRCALMQFLDCVITQQHRFDLSGKPPSFIQHLHSLYKIPARGDIRDIVPIGRGEEVWLGLHAAVKCDSDELMVNADTSGSIFKSRSLNLIEFYAQVVRGYTQSLEGLDMSRLTIDKNRLFEFERILKGVKLVLRCPGAAEKVKKFDKFTRNAADNEYFKINNTEISVAQFFLDKYDYRLKCPKFPCLQFYNKMTKQFSSLPMELFWTVEEPTRFKGKLTDRQLDVFVKAVCQDPSVKKERIQRFCVGGGDYLGASDVMKTWGVSLDRKMVNIDDCPVLPYPHIEMRIKKDSVPNDPSSACGVDLETGQWKITATVDGREIALPPIEKSATPVYMHVVFVRHAGQANDRANCNLLRDTLLAYGLQVWNDVGHTIADVHVTALVDKAAADAAEACAAIEESKNIKKIQPLLLFVFNQRNAKDYGAIKYLCDVKYGMASQCTVRKTFEKLTGSCVTNTSAQNLLLKILAKMGSVHYRLSPIQHKNIERIQNEDEPTLILGVDVSHPGREERFDAIDKHNKKTGATPKQANQYRGQHEKLPTARPAGASLFEGMSFYDVPRSVVAVVGTTDIKGSRYGVSARVQRLGQEETVNMVEPLRERIQEFFDNTKKLPKHIIMYRDGASDTQVKKIAYEELESLERALETFGIEKDQVTITYITAVKRHHTRLFRADLDQRKNQPHLNCPPGTLVENTITHRNRWDFFLQSHYGNLGTALPTRYTVVRDDWNVSTSFVQTIVFAHCFGNARCPKPLSIPVPLHYAHLAAKRAKVHFDHYKEYPDNEYCASNEDLVREEYEKNAITPHPNIKEMKGMHYA